MGGRIDCYLDIISFYSYLTYLDLIKNRAVLDSHGVQVEFHPVFLGGINAGSGNKPPWTLPAKAHYGQYDFKRSVARFPGLVVQPPKDLMAVALTVVPLRALLFIKRNHSRQTFETALHYLMYRIWSPPDNMDLSKPENVIKALSEVPHDFKGHLQKKSPPNSPLLFTADEVKTIMQSTASQEIKDLLKNTTQDALDKGAFGAPWLWVTNSKGRAEPFFGSDRFHFIYKFLDLPVQELALLPVAGDRSKL
ncbi:thioredoxin-like protein [Apodospora peruviana]|uniref:Glutathione S-transferase kappa 1 n=1 Tax=Apodospora peruviana TaxID=516989 RepID=A0AAE0ICK7_9PEZI|nr:thioredoxin-like protein [Apodospora peruviana]